MFDEKLAGYMEQAKYKSRMQSLQRKENTQGYGLPRPHPKIKKGKFQFFLSYQSSLGTGLAASPEL